MTETWLTTNILNVPSNYTIYRCDRDSKGGGVMIAVCNQIPYEYCISSLAGMPGWNIFPIPIEV